LVSSEKYFSSSFLFSSKTTTQGSPSYECIAYECVVYECIVYEWTTQGSPSLINQCTYNSRDESVYNSIAVYDSV
jgi:hypothetical protein